MQSFKSFTFSISIFFTVKSQTSAFIISDNEYTIAKEVIWHDLRHKNELPAVSLEPLTFGLLKNIKLAHCKFN